MRARVLFGLLGLLVIASCAGEEGRVTGIVTSVQGDLTGIAQFEVRPPGGEPIVFIPEDGMDVFKDGVTPNSHLFEHISTGEPVRVTYRTTGQGNIATLVEDA